MFVVNVYCKFVSILHAVNFHHEHSIVPTNCLSVSEDDLLGIFSKFCNKKMKGN